MEKFPPGMLRPEAERYFGVILEEINGKFDLLVDILDRNRKAFIEKQIIKIDGAV